VVGSKLLWIAKALVCELCIVQHESGAAATEGCFIIKLLYHKTALSWGGVLFFGTKAGRVPAGRVRSIKM